jgi:hypothetical protein
MTQPSRPRFETIGFLPLKELIGAAAVDYFLQQPTLPLLDNDIRVDKIHP